MHRAQVWLTTASLAAILAATLTMTVRPLVAASGGSTLRVSHEAPELLASGLQGASGSTIGPDGALYVTEGAIGRISRIDRRTGRISTFASGLPPSIIGLGGVTDVAFIGRKAYALVTLVSPVVGGNDVSGIYRIDGPQSFSVVADIATFAEQNPPQTPFDVASGLQFAMEVFNGDFLVTDGHHNRVLRVTRQGQVSEAVGFGNIVPTGLAVAGRHVFMAQAGPVPHRPDDGKVVVLNLRQGTAVEVAAGLPLLVDVVYGPDHRLYALSQGVFPSDGTPAAPALPGTGVLARVDWNGTLSPVVTGLNQPTSVEIIDDTAYVVTLNGEVWQMRIRGSR